MIDSIDPGTAITLGITLTAVWLWIEVTCAKADR